MVKNNRSFDTTDLRHPYNKAGDGPEGPEVRTVADKLRQRIVGLYLTDYRTDGSIRGDVSLIKDLPFKIVNVDSYGKKILIHMVNTIGENITLIIALIMTGRLYYYQETIDNFGNKMNNFTKNTHITMKLYDEQLKKSIILCYHDPRKMGFFNTVYTSAVPAFFKDIGPDLLLASLTTEIDDQNWLRIFSKIMNSSRAICDVLVDQKYVSGIGWYLVMEILYFCGISPHRPTKEINLTEWLNIRKMAHHIIKTSYSYGGLTIRDYISPDGEIGKYPAVVYDKKQDPYGNPVTNGQISGRRTHYVEQLQK